MYSLLDEDLITIRTPAGSEMVCLPELLARLSRGEVDGFAGLRPHQADPWHVFLVSIAASILAHSPAAEPPGDREYWRTGLTELADGQESAWHLVVDDATKPALLQHPLSGQAELDGRFKLKASTPDELDVLVTAKDHDIKMARAEGDSVEAWLFALVTCQTTSGFLGAGNFGTMRMYGGFGNRPVVSLVSDPHTSLRFIEEVQCLNGMRADVVKKYGYQQRGVALTWLTTWNRESHQFQMSDLEPWAVEAVRVVRLLQRGRQIIARSSGSKARQIGPRSMDSGDVGDPWTPINVGNSKRSRTALTVSGTGWAPKLLTRILFQQGFELTALQVPRSGDGTLWLLCSALVRGQGTTDGFHRFALPVPARMRPRLLKRESVDQLGKLAQDLLADVSAIESALYIALMSLAEGGPESVDIKNETVVRWVKSVRPELLRGWEEHYFPTLWELADAADRTVVIGRWRRGLVELATEALRNAEQRLPLPSTRRYRALVSAEGVLLGALWKAGLMAVDDQKESEAVA